MRYRDATPADAGALARTVIDGFELYRAFAPAGWEPPTLASELDLAIRLLPDPRVWTRVAEEDGRIVGQISILPATMAGRPAAEPGLAHLRNLFVDREHWGSGIAGTLLRAGADEARARGFKTMRLFTPAGQARARRFYEREGWGAVGGAFPVPELGLELVEYRYELSR
jgi:GNAT superfamily N-acetyltransferase